MLNYDWLPSNHRLRYGGLPRAGSHRLMPADQRAAILHRSVRRFAHRLAPHLRLTSARRSTDDALVVVRTRSRARRVGTRAANHGSRRDWRRRDSAGLPAGTGRSTDGLSQPAVSLARISKDGRLCREYGPRSRNAGEHHARQRLAVRRSVGSGDGIGGTTARGRNACCAGRGLGCGAFDWQRREVAGIVCDIGYDRALRG